MKNFLLLVSFFAAMCVGTASNVVPADKAQKVSRNFIAERLGTWETPAMRLNLEYTAYDQDGNALFYRFKVGNKGFIIVSAIDEVAPVLAYSFESNFQAGTPADMMCEKYKAELSEIVKSAADKSVQATPAHPDWARYSAFDFSFYSKDATAGVQPLVTTTWNQSPYYNSECPYNPLAEYSSEHRAPVGCVALTMANIMFYYRYPANGYGAVSYFPVEYNDDYSEVIYSYPCQTANFSRATYDYDAMPNSIESYNFELANLLYHCGVSVRMGYGHDGSGTQSEKALTALQNHFSYAAAGQFQNITDVVTDTANATLLAEWEAKLVNELDNRRPIFYSGQSQSAGGHAWIVDGYTNVNDINYFHVNWGWGGADNGFYRLKNMRSSSYGNFNYNWSESMMVNLYPNTSDSTALLKPTSGHTRITASNGTISDGAGNVKYSPNTDRSWVLACPNAAGYQLQFYKIKTKEGDYITIYNGGTEASGIRAQYSGDYLMAACSDYTGLGGSVHGDYQGQTLPGVFNITADSVLIKFTSNADENTDYGFVMEYKVRAYNNVDACASYKEYKNVYNTTLTDKKDNATGDGLYKPSNVCQYRLSGLKYNTGYNFIFHKFDLKAGDYIEFYDVNNNNDLIVRYTADNRPYDHFMISTNDVLVKFVTDNWKEGTGFELEFDGVLGVDQYSDLQDVNIYPNPASENLNVSFKAGAQKITASVVDMAGKVVLTDQFNHENGEGIYTIPVNSLSNGIYFLNLQTKTGKVTYKFIVK